MMEEWRVTRSTTTHWRSASLGLAIGILSAGLTSAQAEPKYGPGASATEIKIGQTMPYSGPASAYSTIAKAEAAYFQMINDQGGINGRKINLISYDDGYSPPKTVEQVRKLVESDEVHGDVPDARHRSEYGHPEIHECQEGADAIRGDRRGEIHRSQELPLDDWV